jgi:hypothetical protein
MPFGGFGQLPKVRAKGRRGFRQKITGYLGLMGSNYKWVIGWCWAKVQNLQDFLKS